MSVPRLLAIQHSISASEEAARVYLVGNGVLIRPERCPGCDGDMTLKAPTFMTVTVWRGVSWTSLKCPV